MARGGQDYTIELEGGRVALTGVLRLSSPLAYEELLKGATQAIGTSTTGFTVDLSGVEFLNSCGVTAVSRLILQARKLKQPLVLVGSRGISWHGRTLKSLNRLYDGAKVEFVD